MKLKIEIPFNNKIYSFSLLPFSNSQRIYVSNFCVIDVFKEHNHRYCFQAFFYASLHIRSLFYYSSKKELYCAIQKLLQEELDYVKQF